VVKVYRGVMRVSEPRSGHKTLVVLLPETHCITSTNGLCASRVDADSGLH